MSDDRFSAELEAAKALAKALGPFTEAVLVNGPTGRFAVPVEDMYVGRLLRQTGNYAEAELVGLRGLCTPATRLLVVGAHIGALAIPLARVCRDVVAIEANPRTIELLNINVGLNHLTNVRVIHKAASNKAETIKFLLSRVNSGGSKRVPILHNPDYFYDNPQVTEVEAAPLDELLPAEAFDVILMDIEGSEYFALQGMQRILSGASALQVEFLPCHLREVANVSIPDFVSTIAPHFHSLIVPHRRILVGAEQFVPLLTEMYVRDESDAGLVFLRLPPERLSVRFV